MFENDIEYLDSNPNSHYLTYPGKVGGMCIGYDTIEFFIKKLEHVNSYLEIGSFDGIALSIYALKYPEKQFYAIDIFGQGYNTGGGHKEYFKDNTKNCKNVRLYTTDSKAMMPALYERGLRVDLIFIDGDHGYETVKQDLINSYKMLNPGGQIYMHDSSMESVLLATDEVCNELGIQYTMELNMNCFTKS